MPVDLKDVYVKAAKATALYRDAEAAVQTAILTQLAQAAPTTRRQRHRTLDGVQQALEGLRKASRPQVAGLVRLAYVRGGRQAFKGFELNPNDMAAVVLRAHEATVALDGAVHMFRRNAAESFRRRYVQQAAEMLTANPNGTALEIFRSFGQPALLHIRDAEGRSWGLEQYADATLRNVGRTAAVVGALSALGARGYDASSVFSQNLLAEINAS